MIRLEGLSNEFIEKLLSGIVSRETTEETYKYWRFISELLPADETITYVNLIWEALNILREIQVLSKDTPSLNKDTILNIVDTIMYSEIKESRYKGYLQFMRYNLGEELDVSHEASIVELGRNIRAEVITLLDNAVVLNYSLEDSYAVVPEFVDHYGQIFSEELSNLIKTLKNNDSSLINELFWGWNHFLNKYKIKSIKDLSSLLTLSSSHYQAKVTLNLSTNRPLTAIEQVEELEKIYLATGESLFNLGFDYLDVVIPPKPHEMTLCVGERGLGKTKIGAFISSFALKEECRVLFYSPEINRSKLLFDFVLPSYIRNVCGFLVTSKQILRQTAHYPEGSQYSPEEKQNLVNFAKLKFVEKGNFLHIDKPYKYISLYEDFRSDVVKFQPNVVIWDHTQDIRGNVGMTEMTLRLAEVFEDIKREFPVHIFALSHIGGDFRIPTADSPIVTGKINSYSAKLEIVADNIVGMFGSEGQRINFFFTKLRYHPPIPMWKTFRMDALHNWFYYLEKDQHVSALKEPLLSSLQESYANKDLQELLGPDAGLDDDLFSL